jgi:GNAT superfamily N-acetyltransferase
MTPTITLSDKPDPAVAKALHAPLLAFNNAESHHPYDARSLVLAVMDPETNAVLGGLWGSTSYGWLHVDMLILPESFRHQGIGTELMRQAEAEAIARGCRGAYLDTFSFQARGFYERLGYTVFGTLPDHPPGHSRYFLAKRLA